MRWFQAARLTRAVGSWSFALLVLAMCATAQAGREPAQASGDPAQAVSAAASKPAAESVAIRPAQRFEKVLWCSDAAVGPALARRTGFTAVQLGRGGDPAKLRARGLRFYLDQPIGKGLLELRDAQWRPVVQAFERTRDAAVCVRPTCFATPGVVAKAAEQAAAEARRVGAEGLLFVALADEASSTRHNAPLDTCRCAHCLAAFRIFLKQRVGSLDAVNATLGSLFRSAEHVVPLSTDQIRNRELGERLLPRDLRAFSLWLEFVDGQFAAAIESIRARVAAAVPGVPVGLTGLAVPGPFGGHDYARLLRQHTLAEPYDIGASRELAQSLLPADAHRYATLAPPAPGALAGGGVRIGNYIRAQLAQLACHGHAGVVVWNDRTLAVFEADAEAASRKKASEKNASQENAATAAPETPPKLTPFGRAVGRAFADLGASLDLLAGARVVPSGVWVVESQASVRAWWMLDSAPDGMTWVRRLASYEEGHSTSQATRVGWTRLLQDLGHQPHFVAAPELADRLLHENPRCVVLPAILALSDRSAQALEVWVQNGGTLIADHSTGLYTEQLLRRDRGALDGLFGITERSLAWRDLLVREGASTARSAGASLPPAERGLRGELGVSGRLGDAFLERSIGRGRALYLNATLSTYPAWRLEPQQFGKARELRRRLRSALQRARVWPPCEVVGEGIPTCIERVPLQLRDGRRVLAVRLHALDRPALLKQLNNGGGPKLELLFRRPQRLRVLRGAPAAAAAGEGAAPGAAVDRIQVQLDPFSLALVEVGR
ncbi:MAG: alpha-amylase family protein [Planctomycetota bacterium]